MAKQTKLEKAIVQIDGEIEVLQAVRKRLVDQQDREKPKKVVKKKPEVVSAA